MTFVTISWQRARLRADLRCYREAAKSLTRDLPTQGTREIPIKVESAKSR